MNKATGKKSRAGTAILFLVLLMVVFVVVVVSFTSNSEKPEDDGGLGGIFESANKVGVIEVEGTINSADKVLKQLRKFRKRSSVKAVLLRINSPGGAVAPAQEIYREIIRTRKKKPVVASMETIGTSAAYYIASATDRIVCSKGTITGSIGVIMVLAEVQKVVEKVGIKVNVIKAGKYKDMGSSVRPMTDEERRLLETFAEEIHEQFIADVEEGRKGKIDGQKLRSIADGSFFTGQKAKELGLVDNIGNFYDAVRIAAELGGVEGEPKLVYPKKKWDSYLDLFLESAGGALGKAADRFRLTEIAPTPR